MAILILINLAIQDFSRIHYIYIDFVGIYISEKDGNQEFRMMCLCADTSQMPQVE
jgi:hypothetical protein